jgi:hypothetical protein
MQESDISAKVRQSCFSEPFSLQSKQLQPDYVSSYLRAYTFYIFRLSRRRIPYSEFCLLVGPFHSIAKSL